MDILRCTFDAGERQRDEATVDANLGAAGAAVLALTGVPAAIVTIQPSGQAHADVCASAGRRVTVSGCANLSDVMAPYVPPPSYYAPLPEDYPPPPPPPPRR